MVVTQGLVTHHHHLLQPPPLIQGGTTDIHTHIYTNISELYYYLLLLLTIITGTGVLERCDFTIKVVVRASPPYSTSADLASAACGRADS